MKILGLKEEGKCQIFNLIIVATPSELDDLHAHLLGLKDHHQSFLENKDATNPSRLLPPNIFPHIHYWDGTDNRMEICRRLKGFRCDVSESHKEEEDLAFLTIYCLNDSDIL